MVINSKDRRRRGVIIVYAALCVTVLIGLTALTIDIGYKHDRLRHVQTAADSSALSGVADLFKNWLSNYGNDPTSSAANCAQSIAAKNGFANGQDGTTVVVHIPPASGPNTGKRGYAEVIITKQFSRFFSRMYNASQMSVQCRAVARASYDEIGDGIIVLDLEAKAALNAHGGGNITITGNAPVIVNSKHNEAAITNGSDGAQVRASQFKITGNYLETGNSKFANSDGSLPAPIQTGTPPVPDPLAYLPQPNAATMPQGTMTSTNVPGSGGVKNIVMTPGVYKGGVSFTGKDNVTMMPGIYYMDQGGFNFSGQGSLTANGVMIYNNPNSSNSQQINITGQGSVVMSPPDTGMYKGILVFQNRTSETPINVVGNGNFKIGGTFYAASALVKISGNGDSYIGSQYISRFLDLGGNGSLTIDYNAAPHPSKRVLQLVE